MLLQKIVLIAVLIFGSSNFCNGCTETIRKTGTRIVLKTVHDYRVESYYCYWRSTCTHMVSFIKTITVTKLYSYFAVQCCGGYQRDGNDNCMPICTDCVNGDCIRPGLCSCWDGYKKLNGSTRCLPYCSSSCIYSECVKPNTCSCLEGYKRKTETMCIPDCPNGCGKNAVCVSPGKCACNTGYEMLDGACKPICKEPCINGQCIEPNVCQCNTGYKYKNESSVECEPVCKGGCLNGICVKPEVCECNDGYELDVMEQCSCDEEIYTSTTEISTLSTTDEKYFIKFEERFNDDTITENYPISTSCLCNTSVTSDIKQCIPKCTEPCIHGECIKPDVCLCKDRYRFIPESKTICEPECDEECVNGYCNENHECDCNNGYKKYGRSCIPTCNEDCINGYCIRPNVCECYENYTKNNNDSNQCDPICEPECENGDCLAPGLCECYDGYVMSNDTNKCETCTEECINGYCNGTKCQCFNGFKVDDNNSSLCIAVCNKPCINGKCVGPDICDCNEGYNTSGSNVCSPICNPNCINADCILPNVCSCLEGYENSTESHECTPICDEPCLNGTCIGPNECSCNDGYQLRENSTTECEPLCYPQCENATCILPDVCECIDGFAPDSKSEVSLFCTLICIAECGNGTCTPTDMCDCADESIFDTKANSTCVPIKNKLNEKLSRNNEKSVYWITVGIVIIVLLSIGYVCKRYSISRKLWKWCTLRSNPTQPTDIQMNTRS